MRGPCDRPPHGLRHGHGRFYRISGHCANGPACRCRNACLAPRASFRAPWRARPGGRARPPAVLLRLLEREDRGAEQIRRRSGERASGARARRAGRTSGIATSSSSAGDQRREHTTREPRRADAVAGVAKRVMDPRGTVPMKTAHRRPRRRSARPTLPRHARRRAPEVGGESFLGPPGRGRVVGEAVVDARRSRSARSGSPSAPNHHCRPEVVEERQRVVDPRPSSTRLLQRIGNRLGEHDVAPKTVRRPRTGRHSVAAAYVATTMSRAQTVRTFASTVPSEGAARESFRTLDAVRERGAPKRTDEPRGMDDRGVAKEDASGESAARCRATL